MPSAAELVGKKRAKAFLHALSSQMRDFYYRGLQQWTHVPGYLRDTCLAAQDDYKLILDYFKIKYKA